MTLKNYILTLGLLLSVMASGQNQLIDKLAAIVGDNAVLVSTLETEMTNIRGAGENERCGLLESLMIQELFVDQAKIDTIEVSADEVDADLDRRLSGFLARLGGDKKKLEQMYKKSYNEIRADFKEIVRKQKIGEKVKAEITKDIQLTPSDVTEYFAKIPADSLPTMEKQYELLEISIMPEYSKVEIEKTKEKLNGFKKRIADGTKFETLAIMYSEGPSSVKGGELGYMDRRSLDKTFSATAFKLKKGEVSEVVKSEFGYHIIQLIGRRGEQINVRHILLKPKVTIPQLEKAEKMLDSVANLLREEKITFHEAAFLHSTNEDTKNNGGLMINPATGSSLFTGSILKELRIYDAVNTIKVKEVSDPFLKSDPRKGKSISIISIKSIVPAHKLNMQEDYQMLLNNATNYKTQTLVNKWIEKKVKSTYVKMAPEYHTCKFNINGWVKK